MSEARAAAEWMAKQVEQGELLQQEAACYLEETFGEPCIYYNDHGNLAIARSVLREFKALAGDRTVWSRSGRYWRLRGPSDDDGRAQH